MTAYIKMVEDISCKHSNLISKYSADLFEYLGLNQFYFYKISDAGFYVSFDSHISWFEYFAEKGLYRSYPFHCNPKFIRDGLMIYKDVQADSLTPIFEPRQKQFDIRLTVKLTTKLADGIEVFGFSSSCANENQISCLLNELPLLRLFAKKFRSDNQSFFGCLDDYQIYLPDLVGKERYEKDPLALNANRREALLKKMGGNSVLSKKETAIILRILRGYSASMIASQIRLSKRTVEHHIERIKEKLGCYSKAELIQKARELEELGYFMPELERS